jgi:hypothetical protein
MIARRVKSAKLRMIFRYMQKILRQYKFSPVWKFHMKGAWGAKIAVFKKPKAVGSMYDGE